MSPSTLFFLWVAFEYPHDFLFYLSLFLSLISEDFAQLCNVARSEAGLRERAGYEYGTNQEDHHYGLYNPDLESYYNHLGLEYGASDTSLSSREPGSEFGDSTVLQAPQTQPRYFPGQAGKYWRKENSLCPIQFMSKDMLNSVHSKQIFLSSPQRFFQLIIINIFPIIRRVPHMWIYWGAGGMEPQGGKE